MWAMTRLRTLFLAVCACTPIAFAAAHAGDGRTTQEERARGKIVFELDPGIGVVNADGSSLKRVARRRAWSPVWSPAGSRIAFVGLSDDGDEHIYSMSAEGTNVRLLSSVPGSDPAWSPDGSQIAFDGEGEGEADGVVVVHEATGSWKAVGEDPSGRLSWSPEGQEITYGTETGLRVVAIASGITGTVKGSEGIEAWGASWSPVGRSIAFFGAREETPFLFVADLVLGTVRAIARADPSFLAPGPAWSPDGRLIGYTSEDDVGGHVYVVSADGSGQRRLTPGPSRENWTGFAWSPDGDELVVARDRLGAAGADIFRIPVDGATAPIALTEAFPQAWSYGSPHWAAGAVRRRVSVDPRVVAARPTRTLRSFNSPVLVAARGDRIAIGYECGGGVRLWRLAGRSSWISLSDGCGTGAETYVEGVELVGAARTLLVYEFHEGNSVHVRSLVSVLPSHKRSRTVAVVELSDGRLENLESDGSLTVFNTWRDHSNRRRSDRKLWRVDGDRRILLRTGARALSAEAVDDGRIVLRRGAGIELVDRHARTWANLRIDPSAEDVALQGRHLVTVGRRTVDVYDVVTRMRIRRLPAKRMSDARAELAGVVGGLVAYVDGAAIRLLRVRDGRHVALRPFRVGPPVSAVLTEQGLVYSFSETWALASGRTSFISTAQLNRQFDLSP